MLVLSPTRTKRGILGDSMQSFAVTADASNCPVNIPFVWEYQRKFPRARLCGIVQEKEISTCSLVRRCGSKNAV